MAEDKAEPRATGAVDREIGARIRARRQELGISQEKLAEAIGVTFQQVQKYEKATNRVSAATLLDIARALAANPTSLLPDDAAALSGETNPLDGPEVRQLTQVIAQLTPNGRRLLLVIARALVSEEMQRKRPLDEGTRSDS